jgi:homoserine O-acetyltransferase
MARSLHIKQGNVTFAETDPFRLDLGGALSPVNIRFTIYGEPNAAADNVILICHALSGSSRADQWWPQLFAPGAPFANDDYCIVCTNILGSCYGSTGPLSINPATGAPYGSDFPAVTIGDIVRAQARALDLLGIARLRAVIGGSIGGMQALEWAIRFPDRVDDVIAIGAAPLGSLGLALNHLQRRALTIAADPREGLRLARAIAMCTYKSPELFDERHGRRPNRRGPAPWQSADGLFDIAGYLDHQGAIFDTRFDPNSYTAITRAMDLWDPERDYSANIPSDGLATQHVIPSEDAPKGRASESRDPLFSPFSRITARVSLVGISSDWLFPAADVHALAHQLRDVGVDAPYHEIHSPHGHDSFLAEPQHITALLNDVLERSTTNDSESTNDSVPTKGSVSGHDFSRADPCIPLCHSERSTPSVSGHDFSRANTSAPFSCNSGRSTLACAAEGSQHSPG